MGTTAPVPLPRATPVRRDAFRFWTTEKLRNADTDQFHHVNNAAIASFLEAGRIELFSDRVVAAAMAGANIVVGQLLITFHAELFYPGAVDIGSTVSRIGRTSFDVQQGVFHGQICVATGTASCVLMRSGKPAPVPDPVRAHLLATHSLPDTAP
jgi:acyl-CoA thioester hydrolase